MGHKATGLVLVQEVLVELVIIIIVVIIGFYIALYTPERRLKALTTLLPLVTGPFI